jgi:parvulin-like peptidyl-prolyl isomerase
MKKIALSIFLVSAFAIQSQAKVYATIGDKKITDVDIEQVLRILPNGQLIKNLGGIDKLDSAKKKQIIDISIDNYLIAKKSFSEGIEKTDEYKKQLENIKNSLATQLYSKKIIDSIKISDKDVKNYYDNNKQKFTEPEDKVKARHILVKDEKKAKKLIKELEGAKDKEAKFIELAKKNSIGPSKVDGGELGWFDAKRMVPEFSKAAFALKKGEFTKKPVKTQFGYHVIYLQDRLKKGTVVAFDSVKVKIKEALKAEKTKEKFDELIKSLREKTKVEYSKE